MNLKTKFQLAISSLVVTVVAGMMFTLYFDEREQLRVDFEREQQAELAKLAGVCEHSFLAKDEPFLLNYSKSLMMSPVVAYAGFFNSSTNMGWIYSDKGMFLPVRANDPNIQEILLSDGLVRRQLKFGSDNVTELSIPVKSRGLVRLGYSEEALNILFQVSFRQKFKRVLLVGVVSLIFGLLLAQFLGSMLSRPLRRLIEAANALARGEKNIYVPVQSYDEVGRLTRTFNAMAGELAKLDKLKDDFMSHVTHELRSPLTSIIATIDLINDVPEVEANPRLRRSVDRLVYGAERLQRLVDNILDLMKMKAGKMSFDIQPVSLPIILHEMADFFAPRAEEKGLAIKVQAPEHFPYSMADPEKVRQILSNLIHNAVKFTNRGEVTLWLRQVNSMAEIGVQDTGVGIPSDQLHRIFEKFEALPDTKNRVDQPVPGSGLGLNIVQMSVRAQGGSVRVQSKVDKGSVFVFTLPLAPEKIQRKFQAKEMEEKEAANAVT
jgi:signal transduction histidine kinase